MARSRAIICLNMMALRVMPKADIRNPRKTKRESDTNSGEWKYRAINGAEKNSMT